MMKYASAIQIVIDVFACYPSADQMSVIRRYPNLSPICS